MFSKKERVFAAMMSASFDDLRAAFITRSKMKSSGTVSAQQFMDHQVYELITAPDNAVITDDGREILRVNGQAWVLQPEEHTERLRLAFDSAKERSTESEPKSVVGTESLSTMTCPKCGDMLQYTSVCPNCAAGKLGYRHRYTCVCGGTDLISKEAL